MNRLSGAPVTKALLLIITAVFAIELVKGGLTWENLTNTNTGVLFQMGGIVYGLFPRHEYWRLFAAMFLHGGALHFLANMWSLYQLGSLYETMFGSVRFTLFFFLTGLCASVTSALHIAPNGVGVGASGAIFGILGAFIFSIRRSSHWRAQPWTRGLLGQLVFWGLVNIALGASVKVIDNSAHLGGLISGLLLGLIPHRLPPPSPGSTVIDLTPTAPPQYVPSDSERARHRYDYHGPS